MWNVCNKTSLIKQRFISVEGSWWSQLHPSEVLVFSWDTVPRPHPGRVSDRKLIVSTCWYSWHALLKRWGSLCHWAARGANNKAHWLTLTFCPLRLAPQSHCLCPRKKVAFSPVPVHRRLPVSLNHCLWAHLSLILKPLLAHRESNSSHLLRLL